MGLAALMLNGFQEAASLDSPELTKGHVDRASLPLPFTLRVWSWVRFPMECGRYVS